MQLTKDSNNNNYNENEDKKQNSTIINSNYSLLNSAVAKLNSSINGNNINNNNGCGRFPTGDSTMSKISYNDNALKYNQFGNGQQFLHIPITQSKQHSPSPDTLSDISQHSVSFLPHPRPKHNIREQLLNAGISKPNGFLVSSKQPHLSFGSNYGPNFPSPTSNSVAMRILALEKKPGTPNFLNLAGTLNGSQQKQSTTAPMSPRSTVFRTKPIIHVNMDLITTTILATKTTTTTPQIITNSNSTKNLNYLQQTQQQQQQHIFKKKVGIIILIILIFFNNKLSIIAYSVTLLTAKLTKYLLNK